MAAVQLGDPTQACAEARFFEYRDAELPDDRAAGLAVAHVVRRVQPQVVIAHWRASLHPDHAVAHRLADVGVLWAALDGIGEGAAWAQRRTVASLAGA